MSAAILGRDIAGKIASQWDNVFSKQLDELVGDTSKASWTADTVATAKKHFDHHTGKTNNVLSNDAMSSIIKDVEAGLSPGQGASTANLGKGNFLTQAFNPQEHGLGGVALAMGMGGVLGGAAAAATGNDGTQGAFIGGLVGGGIKGIGKSVAQGMETKFMGDLLGDKTFSTIASKPATTIDDIAGKSLSELGEGFDNVKMQKIFPDYENDITVLQHNNRLGTPDTNPINTYSTAASGTEIIRGTTGSSVRQQQIDAISKLTDDELKAAGTGAKWKKDVLTGKSDFNVGQTTRMAGLAGSALTGMAFSSKKRDHRRGFNKHRGNRV
jgi:hypothetical protein